MFTMSTLTSYTQPLTSMFSIDYRVAIAVVVAVAVVVQKLGFPTQKMDHLIDMEDLQLKEEPVGGNRGCYC